TRDRRLGRDRAGSRPDGSARSALPRRARVRPSAPGRRVRRGVVPRGRPPDPPRAGAIAVTPLGTVRHPIWLVRHASTAWTGVRWCGRADPPLDAQGDAEAAALARGLGPELPASTTILASPAERALATARALADG